jgi:hypothetical protein
MMSPFTPVGDQARWRILYDLLVKAGVGDVVTYGAMGGALDLDPDEDRHAIQMALRRAAREYEVMDSRALEAVPNEGYRVVEPQRHLVLARQHQKKAGRSLDRGRSKVEHVDLAGVDDETRRAFELVVVALARVAEFNQRLDIRQKKLERQVEAAQSAQEHTSEELADLRARLEKLEAERE